MKKKKENFLDFIPIYNPKNTWDEDKKGIVTVHVINNGFYNWIAQRVFNKPKVSHIKLDEYGSFIWRQMDGLKTVFEISKLVKSEFGDQAEPLMDRLVKYFQILYDNKFIGYVKRR